ncbi:MAG: hypothetical protein IKJ88_05685 [Clostridia bacterium]|nr:hypothetical protein [Clostridia bacterium]MBR3975334.1 hypothetical protein [Clostridia bacterium]
MCYFLYGAVNREINERDYKNIIKNSKYHFVPGDIADVNSCVANCAENYRITSNHCDCESAVGGKDIYNEELKNWEELLLKLKTAQGIKYVLLSKNWWKETNTKQETIHIDDVDIASFLADIENNCLYQIYLYPKYY